MSNRCAPWIGTSTGGKVYPLGPRPEDFNIRMVAHSLANICRYNGHTSQFWSVAAHSIQVARLVLAQTDDEYAALHGLMHDATESILCDIPKPIKPLIPSYDLWEAAAEMAVEERFALCFEAHPVVHDIDKAMVPQEVYNFFPPRSEIWKRYRLCESDNFSLLKPLDPRAGEAEFIRLYFGLGGVK